MTQFNIVFREFEQGGYGIFINDKDHDFFEGVTTDQEKYEEILEALEHIRGVFGAAILVNLDDRQGSLVMGASSLGGEQLSFSVSYRGVRKTAQGTTSNFFKGTTDLFYTSTPNGGEQFQVL